jgi:hypothetical protein
MMSRDLLSIQQGQSGIFLLSTTSSKGQAKQFPGSRLVQFLRRDKVQDAVLDPTLEILGVMRMYLAIRQV